MNLDPRAQLESIRRGLTALPPTAWASTAALLIAAVALAPPAIDLIRTWTIPPLHRRTTTSDQPGTGDRHDAIDDALAQIRGRSMFFLPPPPPRPAKRQERPPQTAPRLERYAGPDIVAVINNTVWFNDGTRRALGEPSSEGIAVLAVDPPWTVRLQWRDAEWTITLFDRTTPRFLEQQQPPADERAEINPPSNDQGP